MTRPQKPPDRKALRSFGLTVGLTLIGLFGLVPWLRHHPVPRWPFVPGALLCGLGLVAPMSLTFPQKWWTRLGLALGWVNSRIILTAIFFALLTPLALIIRLCGGDLLGLKRRRVASYAVPSVPSPREQMERPF